MLSTPSEHDAVRNLGELETALGAVELELAALGQALQAHDPTATETAANALHRALQRAVDRFGRQASPQGVPMPLRRRLAMAGGRVAAQREAVHRASSALDRAIDVLLPAPPQPIDLYAASGQGTRRGPSGYAEA